MRPISNLKEDTIYHYTNQKGLKGIIENRNIWASNCYYLNDEKEFTLALDLLKNKIAKRMKECKKNERTKIFLGNLQQLLESIKTAESPVEEEHFNSFLKKQPNIFVCSFSEKKDLLSQWRAYTYGTSGYSIGFDMDKLYKCCGETFIVLPCIYKRIEQKRIVNMLFSELLQAYKAINNKDNKDDYENRLESHFKINIYDADLMEKIEEELLWDFLVMFMMIAPTLKDSSFREEKEWRVISLFIWDHTSNVKFREGKSMLIPYLKLVFNGKENPITEVIVGPTLHMGLAVDSTRDFVRINTMLDIIVNPSKIPYRNW